ncbi:hypothetical protein PG990_010096 [Apiospora arundinis]
MESGEAYDTLTLQRRPGASFVKDSADDWTGLSSSQLRRKIQNRLNQRACRHRKASSTRRPGTKNSTSSTEPARNIREVALGDRRSCVCGRHTPGQTCAASGFGDLLSAPAPSLDNLQDYSPVLKDEGNRKMFYLAAQHIFPILSERYFPSNEKMTNLTFRLNMTEPVVLELTIGGMAEWSLLRQYSPAIEEIRCKSAMRLIRLVRDGLHQQESAGVVSDATLIDHLGVHENLAHYEFAKEQWAAFLYCLNMRGGIENVDLQGGSESFTLADNVNAAVTGKAPTIGLCKPFRHVLQTWLPQVRSPLTEVAAFPVDDEFKELLLDLRLCCQEIDEYAIRVKKLGDTGSTGMVVPYQNIVQHRLMSRKQRNSGDSDSSNSSVSSAEDICRAAVLVFTLGVTFPLPRADPLAHAAADLGRAMRRSNSSSKNHTRPFLFWSAVLGAIATGAAEAGASPGVGNENAKLYRFFLDQTRRLRGELGLTTWDSAKAMLKTFVWLDKACDEGAWKVWTQSLRPSQNTAGKQATP